MKFAQFCERLYKRVTESRWTVLYITVAALQMIIAVGLEAAVFRLNDNIANEIESAKNMTIAPRTLQHPSYDYKNYLQQFQSITHSNIWFMVFQAFVFLLSVNGLYSQNTIEIIVIGIINVLLLLFGVIQVFQSTKWINRVNDQLQNDRGHYPKLPDNISKSVVTLEGVLVLVLLVFAIATIYIGYRLYRQFGWNIYKKIGANVMMQKMFRTYLIFIMLLKLMFLLLMSFQILNLVFLFQESKADDETNISATAFQIVMVAVIVPMVAIAWLGVRRESIVAMFVFALMALTTIIHFIYVLARFIIKRDENLLTLLDVLGILLCIAAMALAYMAVSNFDKGLRDLFDKKSARQNTVDLAGIESGQPARKPNIID